MPDAAKDTAKVAAGVGLVVAASVRRLCFRDLGSFAFQTLKGFRDSASRIAGLTNRDWMNDSVNPKVEFQDLREVKGHRRNRNYGSHSKRSMDNFEVSQGLKNHGQKKTDRVRSVSEKSDDSQPEELFAPKEGSGVKRNEAFQVSS